MRDVGGEQLQGAVRDELLPLVADTGLPADRNRPVVAGQSLGGLSAVYAALEFPDLVSLVACQSGSFWWTSGALELADPMGGPVGGAIAARLRERPDLSGLRVAFDVGNTTRGCCPTANWSMPWPNRPERPYGCHARRRATTGPAGGTPSSGTSPARSSRACAR